MDTRLCEWCGEPATEDSELCHKCLESQRNVEAGRLVPVQPAKPPAKSAKSALAVAGSIGLFIGKGLAAMVLATIMIAAGLFGSCSALFSVLSVLNPMSSIGLGIMAAVGLGIAFVMFRLLDRMYKSPLRRLSEKNPPKIERKD